MLKEKREKEKKNFLFFILISVLKNIYENLKIVIKKSNRALQKCFVYFKFKNREFLFTNGGSHPMSIIFYATAFSRFTSEKKKKYNLYNSAYNKSSDIDYDYLSYILGRGYSTRSQRILIII